jgi:hypothetical protein
LDKNVPSKYRKSVELGVLEWNKAFEKIVFSNSGMSLKRGDLGGWGVRVDRVEKREV